MASQDHMASRDLAQAGGVKPSREAELKDLLARVAAATGAESYLDASLELALDPANFYEKALQESPPFTASLDAALALVERALPGRRIMLWQVVDGPEWGAHFRSPDTDTQYSATPALAVLAAMLAALIAEAASPEGGSTGVWPNQSPTPLSKTEVQS